jgi:UDP-N-acetylglucosamine--N-acetylmuramyl-(pentapeptide) pyrophosphoryl-undecaprenol N-acetylglucosamine transferase
MDTIGFSGLRGKGLLHTLTGGIRMLAAFVACWRIFGERKADAVLGMGGYVCFPGGVMAAARMKPLMLVNADASLLMSNRALLPVADGIAFGFDGAAATTTKHAVVTGNPVRDEIEALPEPAVRFADRDGPLRVLVVGGSLGAKVLNDTLPKALALIDPAQRPRITHQTGQLNRDEVKALYREQGIDPDVDVEVLPFIDNMAERLADCDVIVCRAYAVTGAAVAAGVASVLVPLMVSTTSHQRDNAQYMAQHGAAIHLPQTELGPERLAETLRGLTRDALLGMATKARSLARPRSAARVADEIERLVTKPQGGAR